LRSSGAILTAFDNRTMRWDVFCRVIDNFGDIGVCWRLARDLAARGESVRLWVDDAAALAWMAPGGAAGVEVGPFEAPGAPGDAVVEAFGCNPPVAFVAAMAETRPVWINLEYLSAEPFVERSHGLPSPQPGGATKWFFFPGFSARTGGLIREPGLLADRAAFDRRPWLARHGIAPRPGERLASLFCYENPSMPALVEALADRPTLLLLAPGAAQAQVGATPAPLRTQRLPWLAQADYDRLLWSCDLNFVRGEDSLVRACWAGVPFVWQIYPQHDGAHAAKLDALLERMPPLPGLAPLWQAWNGLRPGWPGWPDEGPWRAAAAAWRDELAAMPDLTSSLLGFARSRAGLSC
jgi:uncharacterized repeat protein (TIGR03837 family)